MPHSVRILIPEYSGESYFVGKVMSYDSNINVFITKFIKKQDLLRTNRTKDTIQGYYGSHNPKRKPGIANYLQISPDFKILNFFLNNSEITTENCIVMLYDYDKVKDSQIPMDPSECTEYFSTLCSLIQRDKISNVMKKSNQDFEPQFHWPGWLTSSMSAQHLLNYCNLLHWLYLALVRERKFQIKHVNYVIALLIDMVLGYLVLLLISQYEIELSSNLMGMLESLVNTLHSLLKWLMGAPAGLKLNKAFNNMLGKYFSYHIQLWWLFLEVSGDKLDAVLQVYRRLGYLGATFQAAIICDMLCIATFHSYCIYVYAARLYNIQISGLVALMRLFFGRKRNPLRGGIDSCEYSNQQLFVGTVAFTILLLLLPTTAMYYTVFTILRLVSLAGQYSLARLVALAQALPLYVTLLWLVRSPKLAGKILMEVVKSEEHGPVVLRIKLQSKSLRQLIQNFKPPVEMSMPVTWTNLLSNIFKGTQIV